MKKIEWPPILIGLVLIIEVVVVYSIDRWVVRQGRSAAALHAETRINQEIDLRFQQGVLMLHLKQYEHAITALHRVLQLSPQLPEAHVNMGFAMLGAGKNKEAKDFFAGTLALRAEQINAHYGAALAMKALGEHEDASAEMHNYLMLASTDDPYRSKAEEYLRIWQRELKEAESAKSAVSRKEKKKAPPQGDSLQSPAGRQDGS